MAPIDDPVFNINFVRIIQNYPCIWDQNTVEYSQRDRIERAWKKISREVNDPAPNCRERWRNIRGSFLRSLKKSRHGCPKKKYYLSEYLQFLRPHVKPKAESSELDDSDNPGTVDNQSVVDNPFDNFDDSKSQVFAEGDLQGPSEVNQMVCHEAGGEYYVDPYKMSVGKKRKTESSEIDDSLAEFVKNMMERNNIEREDPNMLFLRSLLPDLVKMTEKQNRKFRLRVIGLIDQILEEDEVKEEKPPCHSSQSLG